MRNGTQKTNVQTVMDNEEKQKRARTKSVVEGFNLGRHGGESRNHLRK
jgi:hypothetical protein